jgi:hypothetical protein
MKVFKFSVHHFFNSKDSKYVHIFSLYLRWSWVISIFVIVHEIKMVKTYLRLMLPPGGGKWQIIYPGVKPGSNCYHGKVTLLHYIKKLVTKTNELAY